MPWAPTYADLVDLADFVRASPDDPWLADYAAAASRSVDGVCGRQFGKLDAPASWVYPHDTAIPFRGRWLVPVLDTHSVVGVGITVDGAVVSGAVWGPASCTLDGTPFTTLSLAERPGADITMSGVGLGWASVPPAVTAAVRLQVHRWHTRRESPFGVAGSPSEGGSADMRLTAVLDPDVRAMVATTALIRKRWPR